jgi:putative hydrolase of the HAD superfamily
MSKSLPRLAQPVEPLDGIRAVTFDVGGTLIEPWPSVGHIYAAVAARNDYPGLSPHDLNRRFAAAWRDRPDFQHSRLAWADLVDATFRGLTARPPSSTFFPELYDRFSEPDAWHVFGDVFTTLKSLAARKVKLAVISNWDERLEPLLRRLKLARWFDAIVVSCHAGRAKPHLGIFRQAASALRLPPAAILHVGDSPGHDVQGARAAGFSALLLRRNVKRSSSGVIHSLTELS